MADGPVAPVPAAGSPAARTVVPTPKPVVAPAPAPVVAAPDATELATAKAAALNAQRNAEIRINAAKRAHEAEKKTIGAKLTELETLKKTQAQAKLNKSAYLESLYGKDWYDQLTQERINGGAPTAEVVASEIDKVRAEFKAERDAEKAEAKLAQEKAAAQAKEQQLTSARESYVSDAAAYVKSKAEDFPAVFALGTPEEIGAELGRRFEAVYTATEKRDESGAIVVDGKAPSLQELLSAWEDYEVKHTEKVMKVPKYADRFKPNAAPPNVAQQTRRTLSNELVGRTQAERPHFRSEEQRRNDSIAAAQNASKPQT